MSKQINKEIQGELILEACDSVLQLYPFLLKNWSTKAIIIDWATTTRRTSNYTEIKHRTLYLGPVYMEVGDSS